MDVLPEERIAVIWVDWSLDYPFVPKEQSWDLVIENAMIDRRRSFASVDDPQPSYGMSPTRRAMNYNRASRAVSEEQNVDGSSYKIVQISGWRSDG